MFRKFILPTVIGMSIATAIIPSAASAQSFGLYVGQDYNGYREDDRRDEWIARRQWEQRERWEQEQARRRYWQHERWEQEGGPRGYWHDDRWDRRGDWHRGEDDDD